MESEKRRSSRLTASILVSALAIFFEIYFCFLEIKYIFLNSFHVSFASYFVIKTLLMFLLIFDFLEILHRNIVENKATGF